MTSTMTLSKRTVADGLVVDLFAGPGGWDLAARRLGIHTIGYETDPWACATRAMAQLETVPADVANSQPVRVVPLQGLIASPPCQAFSAAGHGTGRGEIPRLFKAVERWAATREPVWQTMTWDDPRTSLVLEPLRWIDCSPVWIALEQVPPVAPLWEAFGRALPDNYSWWSGILNAADYGVPQTRKRAFLIASRLGPVEPPVPTHAQHPEPTLFGPQQEPWVTMADALGWTGNIDRRQQNPDGTDVPPVSTGRPSPTLDGQTGMKWVLNPGVTDTQPNRRMYGPDEPAPTIAFGHDVNNWEWVKTRPATTIVGSFEPDVVAPPTFRGPGDGPRQNQPGAVKITEAEALTLQSFPPDWPVQGPKTARFLQIGNAVPPRLAEHVLRAATRQEKP